MMHRMSIVPQRPQRPDWWKGFQWRCTLSCSFCRRGAFQFTIHLWQVWPMALQGGLARHPFSYLAEPWPALNRRLVCSGQLGTTWLSLQSAPRRAPGTGLATNLPSSFSVSSPLPERRLPALGCGEALLQPWAGWHTTGVSLLLRQK